MISKGKLPTRIAEGPVELDQGRIISLIAPSEFSVLQFDFLEMTCI